MFDAIIETLCTWLDESAGREQKQLESDILNH
jgi:hypothetical protein